MFIRALLGIHPDQVQVPPGKPLSTKRTFFLNPLAVYAQVSPAAPAPIIIKSYIVLPPSVKF